ncbi:MAG TPA: type II secretion system protein [bacterium]|nr:type II secretion system protein [bacterium]
MVFQAKKRLSGQGGFTIVELIATLVVLGILAVTAMTRSFLGQRDLDAVSRMLRSNIQLAQDLAMTNGTTYGFHARGASEYEIFDGAPGTPATNPQDNRPFVVDISPVQFVGTPVDVPFFKSGSPDIALDAVISLSEGGGSRTITVLQDTGLVTMTSP